MQIAAIRFACHRINIINIQYIKPQLRHSKRCKLPVSVYIDLLPGLINILFDLFMTQLRKILMSSDKPSNLYTLYIDTWISLHTHIHTTHIYRRCRKQTNLLQANEAANICGSSALQQRECIVRLSPSPLPFSSLSLFFFWSSFATDHKRKVLKSLFTVTQIKVKVMQLLYIIYCIMYLSLSLFLCFSLFLALSKCTYLCLSLFASLYSTLLLPLSLACSSFLPLSISLYLPPCRLVMHITNGPHKLSCSLPEKNSRVSRKFVQITITKLVYTNSLVLYCNNTKLLDFLKVSYLLKKLC